MTGFSTTGTILFLIVKGCSEMATQWVDVIDTAIKIGLGALISGIATYCVSAMNHKKDIKKSLANKKINMLEDISELAEEYFYFCTKLSNEIRGTQRSAKNFGGPLTEAQSKRISNAQTDLKEILVSRNKAMSKIKILSINAAEDAMTAHNQLLSDFRDIFVFKKTMPTKEETEQFSAQRKIHVDKFYKAIGNYMESISS